MESLGNLTRKNCRILHIVFNMETYYTKKEFNEMKSALTKKCKALETKVSKLTAELKELKKDYAVLLETASEKVED